jgi:hypothetical protein
VTLRDYSEISDHILGHHKSHEQEIYRRVGSFWVAILCFIKEKGVWPKVSDLFGITEQGQQAFGTAWLDREASDRVWREGERQVAINELPTEQILPGSPFEHLLFILRRRASTQPSPEVSDIDQLPDTGEEEDSRNEMTGDSSDPIDIIFRDVQRPNSMLLPRSESEREGEGEQKMEHGEREPAEGPGDRTERSGDEQGQSEQEPDTEHEEIQFDVREMFELNSEIDPIIAGRMNRLAEILMRGSEEDLNFIARGRRHEVRLSEEEVAMVNHLETLLHTCEEEEVPEERLIKERLEDPILSLLAQYRSFQICRSRFFCPVQECRLHKPITSLGRLATHLQTFHGATKEGTADMVRYFIIKLFSNPIQAIYTTRGGRKVNGRRCLCRCHCPGSNYVSGKEYQVSGHVNSKDKSMANDSEKPGWFWGTVRTLMKLRLKMTIAEALGQGDFWQCTMDECHLPFQSGRTLRPQGTQAHSAYTIEGYETKSRRLVQRWSEYIEETDESEETGVARVTDDRGTRTSTDTRTRTRRRT